ncbi:MAG TPA: CHAT domain-containing protein [Polyangiales bacterium]|nr:CHAT domain-containing protein [Polyangiales bacterium]
MLSLLVAAACEDTESDVRAVQLAEPGAVEFAGCLVLERGARCELAPDRKLTFWVPDGHTVLGVRLDGREAAVPAAQSVEAGRSYQLQIPARTRSLEVRASAGALRLELSEPERAPELQRATLLREQGQFGEARALLTAAARSGSSVVSRRARAQLARIALAESEHEAAAAGLSASMEGAARAGAFSEALLDATALSFVASSKLRDYSLARGVLQRAAAWATFDPAGAALLPHYAGVLALETGDLQQALAGFRESARRTRRLGMHDHELVAREQEAWTLVLLGRHDEAVAVQRSVVDEFQSSDACQRADRSESVVWFVIMAEPVAGSPLWSLSDAYSQRSARELESCPSPWRLRNHTMNAALAALQRDDLTGAQLELARLAQLPALSDPLLDTWEHELRGRIALRQKKPRKALPQFQAALGLSERAGLWDNRQLAQLGCARAFAALRQRPLALTAYAAAERSLDDSLAQVPFSEGQSGFRRAREAGTEEWIELLLRTSAAGEAFEVARAASARQLSRLAAAQRARNLPAAARTHWEAALARYHALRGRAERAAAETWQLPQDRLAQHRAQLLQTQEAARAALDEAYAALRGSDGNPELLQLVAAGADETLVGLFPARSQLRVFLQTRAGTQSWTVPGAQALGELLLRAAKGSRLRVIAHPSLASLDVHALLAQGERLLERFEVRYASDVAQSGAFVPAAGALVVSDPRGDLPGAAQETELVTHAVAPAQLLSGAGATRGEVLRALAQASYFHYAGHHKVAGIEGTESALLLADGELSVGDVLMLPRVPERIVLATCEGARQVGVLGMGQAFLVAGAEEVIAASRPVADRAARELVVQLYAELKTAGGLAEALRRAQLALWAREPREDWAAFRALGR